MKSSYLRPRCRRVTKDAASTEKPKKSIVWLASYPKSGNTWTRALLSNLLGQDSAGRNDRLIQLAGSISSNRPQFDQLTGLSSSDLTDDEIDLLRPDVYRATAKASSERLFFKVHDAYHLNTNGQPIFPSDCSWGAIYLVRNPLDVVVSYAHHQGHTDFGNVAKQLNSSTRAMAGGPTNQLRQNTMGWLGHYRSWHNQSDIKVLTIRYEDMLFDTAKCLKRMAQFLRILEGNDPVRIRNAVTASSFATLQSAEQENGFGERPEKAARFFREGKAGEGNHVLPPEVRQRILNVNGDLMRELSYL